MQDNSALRLVNSAAAADTAAAETLAATPTRAARVLSPAAQAAQQQFTYLSQAWGGPDVSDTTRRAYAALGKSYPVGPTGQTSGKAVWMSINATRAAAGMGLLLSPPLYREIPVEFPDYTVSATVSAGGVFLLRVVPASEFTANKTLVTATRPLRSGTMLLRTDQYAVLEVDENVPLAGMSVSTSWLRVYERAPDIGTRIGVCLTPVTPLGFTGRPVYRDTLVTAA